jgi:hypothetical protein
MTWEFSKQQRIDKETLMEVLNKVIEKHPELRLCQIIGNCFEADYDPYYVEDADLTDLLIETYFTKD